MGRLFGTDGVRGIANVELTVELATKISKAAAMVLTKIVTGRKPRILIGMDTRISGDMLQSALAAGFCSVGVDVETLGVVSTPAVAYLVKKGGYDAAVMISASHNPCEYNGIKIFQGNGLKLPDELEEEIESIILDETKIPPVMVGSEVGRVCTAKHGIDDYIEHLKSTVDVDFEGMKIALDCANGSSAVSAERLFSSLGAELTLLSDEPDGVNINKGCGSTHMENLCRAVRENGLCAGFAFDGDADRMLAVDENGEIVDGDKIIAICSKYFKEEGKLKDDTAVVTVMTNMGFYKFCEENGIKYETTKVGDRYVLEKMLKEGFVIGGEQSGHVIFLDYASTGDGQLTALQVLRIMKKTGKKLSELASVMKVYPQTLVNVRVSPEGKLKYATDKDIKAVISEVEENLAGTGRVLVRVSGTEPLVRVMLEGENQQQIEEYAQYIAETVKRKLI